MKPKELKGPGKYISVLNGGVVFVVLRLVTMHKRLDFKHLDVPLTAAWFLYGAVVGAFVYMAYIDYELKRQAEKVMDDQDI